MPLYTRIYFRLLRWLLRLSVTTRENIYLISLARLRMAFDLPMPGVDEELDEKLFASVKSFLDAKLYLDELTNHIENNCFATWLSKDQACKDLRNKYFAILHWSSPHEDNRSLIEESFQQLNGIRLTPLSNGEIWKLNAEVRKQWQSTLKSLRESKAQTIDLRLRDLTMIIPWVSAALICSGYVYTLVVYRHFGVDPTSFFSVGDYLGASLEQMDHAIFSFLGYVLGTIHGYRKQFMFARNIEHTSKLRKWWSEILMTSAGSIGLALIYYNWGKISLMPGIQAFMVVSLLMAIQFPLFVLVDRYFKHALSVSIFFMVLILFFGSMFVSAKIRISEIVSNKNVALFEIVKEDKIYSQRGYSIIGANSRYMFVWDRNNRVEVLSLDSLNQISFSKPNIASNQALNDQAP